MVNILASKLLFFSLPDEHPICCCPVIVLQMQSHRNTRWVNTFLIEDAMKVNRLIILAAQKFSFRL